MQYHKIQSLFKRDPETNYKTFLDEYTTDAFRYLGTLPWYASEKIDGMNMRAIWVPEDEKFKFAGKSDNAQIPGDLYEFMADHFTPDLMDNKWENYNVTFYGEGYGAGIQSGGGYGQEKRFIMFDVRVERLWMNRETVNGQAFHYGVPSPEDVVVDDLDHAIETVTRGFKSAYGDCQAEGMVLRPITELVDQFGERVITKLKTKDFR